jgi:cyclophilin family peptidyl-prolyl cis-trans isomerase
MKTLTWLMVAGLAAGVALAQAEEGEKKTMTEKPAAPPEEPAAETAPRILIETSQGTMVAELWPDKAPITVENFLAYVDAGFFDGTIFHRVIDGFMIQGGGFTPDMKQKKTKPPVKNEARADTPNERGTLAMARTSVVDSATAQFFINLKDNAFLNHRDKSDRGYGYAVFGKLVSGEDVLDRIGKVATTRKGHYADVPVETVLIKSIRKAGPAAEAAEAE